MAECVLCGRPSYSKSVEHGDQDLCVIHYNKWVKAGKPKEVDKLA